MVYNINNIRLRQETSKIVMDHIIQEVVKTNVPVEPKVSWVDRLTLWIDGRPWPVWLFYIALGIVAQVLFNVIFWIDGSVPLWKNVIIPSMFFPLAVLGLAFYHYLSKAGSKALRNYRPLIEADEDEIKKIDRALNYLPSRANWIVLFWAMAGSILYVFFGSNTFGELVPHTILPISVVYILSVLTVMPTFSLFFRIIRQVRILQDLHKRATNINLLYLEPAHAFARLTAGAGGGLILLLVLSNLYNPELSSGANLPGMVLGVLFGVLIFVVPLIGMRNRLIKEKSQRLKEISELLQLTLERIHGKVQNQTSTDIAEAQATMRTLIEERDLIAKVSTWPWDPGTIKGFTSTLVLPIALWFITHFLGKYF